MKLEVIRMGKPNIIYILADDLGYGDLSCYGASSIHTPHSDQLAKEGMLFTDAHAPSAVCTPTRYSILTGRYCFRSSLKEGVLWGHSKPLIETSRLTVPSYLQQHGYATSCIGKWHLGLDWGKSGEEIDYNQPIQNGPVDLGFESFFGISASLDMPPYCFIENNHTVEPPTVEKEPKDFSQMNRTGLMSPGWKDEAVNETITDKAVAYIEDHMQQDPDRPFFMYLPLTGPHTPWSPSEEYKNKSGIGPRGDMILELDGTIGKIVDTLKNLDVWENTLLIFTSDNGPHPKTEEITIHGHNPTGSLRGQKADIWEGGHRIPFIASWPDKIKPGTVSDELICLTDLLGTCAAIMDEPLPEDAGEETRSMLPVLYGDQSNRESVVHHSISGMFSIRRGDWKLIQGKGSGGFESQPADTQVIGIPSQGRWKADDSPGQLYHIKEDVMEEKNVYLENPDIVQALTKELIEIINSG